MERKTRLNKWQTPNSEHSSNEIKHPLKVNGNSLLQAQLNLFRKTLAKVCSSHGQHVSFTTDTNMACSKLIERGLLHGSAKQRK